MYTTQRYVTLVKHTWVNKIIESEMIVNFVIKIDTNQIVSIEYYFLRSRTKWFWIIKLCQFFSSYSFQFYILKSLKLKNVIFKNIGVCLKVSEQLLFVQTFKITYLNNESELFYSDLMTFIYRIRFLFISSKVIVL